MANVTYPQMIAAFKSWYGQNKTRPSKTVEIDGQAAVRKSSVGEMVTAGLTQLAVFAATAGFDFIKGGDAGFNKFLEGLPKEIAEPAKALKENAGKLYDDFKAGIGSLIPAGGNLAQFASTLESGLSAVSENFINPLGNIFTGFKDALTGDASTLQNLSAVYSLQDSNLASLLAQSAGKLGTGISNIIDNAKAWTDEITLGSEYTLKDIFDTVNNGHSTFMATYLGIGEVPSLTDLAGTLVKEDLINDFTGAKQREEEAALKLRQAAAIKFPTIPTEEGAPAANPDIALLENTDYAVSNLSPSEQAAILAEYNQRVDIFQAAMDDLEAASNAIAIQVQTDQQNGLLIQKAQSAVENIGTLAQDYNNITDPDQKALFEKVMKPDVLDATKKIAPIMNLDVTVTIPTVPTNNT